MYDLIPLKVTQGIHSSSSRTPHKVAIRHGDNFVSYSQLTKRMRQVSHAAFTDVRFQGNAAIVGVNSIEFVEVLLGLADVGVPVVTINPKSSPREVSLYLQDSKAKVLFIDKKLYRKEYEQYCELVIVFGDNYKQWVDNQPPIEHYPYVRDNTIFNIVYSSGTTGTPKGICISHRTRLMTSLLMPLDYKCMGQNDIMLAFASLSNGGGSTTVIATLNNGGTVILATQVHPDYIMRTIEKHKVTCAFIVPVLIHVILSTPSCHKYDKSSLKGIFSSAAPFASDMKLKALEFFGPIVYDVFASTECGPTTFQTPQEMKTHLNSVGRVATGSVIKIIDESGRQCQPFEVGEIYSQALTMFSGYLNKDKPDEYVSVGDLGYLDQDNYLYVVGRKNDMIITGGYNVYPEEVENIINSCPGVIESAVVGIPDDKWGEIVTAFVVGMPMADLYELCRNSLASYKVPRKLTYVDSIPRNEVGKILRKNLRNSYK